jgi:hypothetical protein
MDSRLRGNDKIQSQRDGFFASLRIMEEWIPNQVGNDNQKKELPKKLNII